MTQSQTEAPETLKFKLTNLRKLCSFDIVLQLRSFKWVLGITSLELYNSTFKTTNENGQYERFKSLEKKEEHYSSRDSKRMKTSFAQKTLKMN